MGRIAKPLKCSEIILWIATSNFDIPRFKKTRRHSSGGFYCFLDLLLEGLIVKIIDGGRELADQV
jgi:hypothetical protein